MSAAAKHLHEDRLLEAAAAFLRDRGGLELQVVDRPDRRERNP